MTPKISIIAAMSENHVIGRNNQLPWHLPDEWENFRKITDGKAFVMGRKSYEAPDALHSTYKNVVLSRQQTEFSGAIRIDNLERALGILHEEDEVFILGGASVFKEAILLADILYLTVVHAQLDGDAFFPEVGRDHWRLGTSVYHGADQAHEYAFSMNIFTRKQQYTPEK